MLLSPFPCHFPTSLNSSSIHQLSAFLCYVDIYILSLSLILHCVVSIVCLLSFLSCSHRLYCSAQSSHPSHHTITTHHTIHTTHRPIIYHPRISFLALVFPLSVYLLLSTSIYSIISLTLKSPFFFLHTHTHTHYNHFNLSHSHSYSFDPKTSPIAFNHQPIYVVNLVHVCV